MESILDGLAKSRRLLGCHPARSGEIKFLFLLHAPGRGLARLWRRGPVEAVKNKHPHEDLIRNLAPFSLGL